MGYLSATRSTRLVLAIATVVLSSVQAAKSGSFLRRRSASKLAGREHLHAAALNLASALSSELDHSLEFPFFVSAARDLLREKADQRRAHDGWGAGLLDGFAGRALPVVLYMTPDSLGLPAKSKERTPPKAAKRRVLSSKTECKDGKCVTTTVTEDDGETHQTVKEHAENELMGTSSTFDKSIDDFVEEMRPFKSTFPEPSFDTDEAFTDMFTLHPNHHSRAVGNPVDTNGTSLEFPFSHVLKQSKANESEEPSEMVADTANSQSTSFSKSSESHLVNGTMVTTIKTCRNGKCTTEVFKEKVPTGKEINLVNSLDDAGGLLPW